jgi:hypothetical protein
MKLYFLLRLTVSQGQIYVTFSVALPVIHIKYKGSSKKVGKLFLCSVYGVGNSDLCFTNAILLQRPTET